MIMQCLHFYRFKGFRTQIYLRALRTFDCGTVGESSMSSTPLPTPTHKSVASLPGFLQRGAASSTTAPGSKSSGSQARPWRLSPPLGDSPSSPLAKAGGAFRAVPLGAAGELSSLLKLRAMLLGVEPSRSGLILPGPGAAEGCCSTPSNASPTHAAE